ncbi:MAG: hypothetical protein ACH255_19485 [Candidatus Thiodiazotropha sp.]
MASYLSPTDTNYGKYEELLSPIIGNVFPVKGIIIVTVAKSEPIVAPSYYMIPGTTEESQVKQSKITYGVQ